MYFETLPYFAVRLFGTIALMYLTFFYSTLAIRGNQTKKLLAISTFLTLIDIFGYYLIKDERWFIFANVFIILGFIVQGMMIRLNVVYVIFQWIAYIFISVISGALLNIFFILLGYQENELTGYPAIVGSYVFAMSFGYVVLRWMSPVFKWLHDALNRRVRLLIIVGTVNAVSAGALLYYIIRVNVFRNIASSNIVMGDTIAMLTAVIVEAAVIGGSYLVIKRFQ